LKFVDALEATDGRHEFVVKNLEQNPLTIDSLRPF
jgi:hypothetical protein